MNLSEVITLAGQFGPLGLLVGYLVWRENLASKAQKEQLTLRNEIDKADIASREKLASSLTMLSMVIQGQPHVP